MNPQDQYQVVFTVTDTVYQGFVQLFSDKNCLHTDKRYAQSKGFADVVMHGNILNGFLSHFIGECLPIKNVIIHSQEINYKKPVYQNDQLTFYAVVTEVIASVSVVMFNFYFENQHKIKVAKGKIQIGVLN
ncbi:MAG: hypothetical protein KBB94_00615 [Legionellaceae bacterium]|nr:hypothetical protein [Legionellaceae bacterium]MBP9774343.1 hypothetical protein [Legionellaceae bacterium]